jgi:hypothetical protein
VDIGRTDRRRSMKYQITYKIKYNGIEKPVVSYIFCSEERFSELRSETIKEIKEEGGYDIVVQVA